MRQIKAFLNTRLIRKKYIAHYAAVALIIAFGGFLLFKNRSNEQAPFVIRAGEFISQISVSGKITAAESVNLSFEQAGIIRGVYVKVGDKVGAGKLIASQDTAQFYAQSLQMQAGIDVQKAKLDQLLAGSASEDIKIKEDAVESAGQDLQNTYASTLAALTSAYNAIYNAYNNAVYLKNTYFAQQDQSGVKLQQIKYELSLSLADAQKALDSARAGNENMDSAIQLVVTGLGDVYNNLKEIRVLADEGAYYASILTADKNSLDTQRANINTALASVIASKQDIVSDRGALLQAKNQLNAIKATPRATDIAVYNAQIKQAEASLQEIYAQIRKKQIIAPIAGIITAVNAKTGSIMASTEVAISIISNGAFQIESYVPEIYISSVSPGNQAEITLDAYGQDKKFMATVVSIDPSQTQKDGGATYKTKLQFTDDGDNFKDGMSANVVIITNKKQNVISVPQGLIKNKDGKKTVNVKNGDQIVEKEVQTGDVSSSGQVEIIFGLFEGDVLPLH